MKAFIGSQFVSCQFIWVFCGRNPNNRINHLHERTQGAVYNNNQSPFYNNNQSPFQYLITEDCSVSVFHLFNISPLRISCLTCIKKWVIFSVCRPRQYDVSLNSEQMHVLKLWCVAKVLLLL